ncbi:lipoate--protein ligase family protein [Bifidobacterium leontopitheci]|nr:lipoate--protein ligase family protein [Bifidobacterium leontopitheci]
MTARGECKTPGGKLVAVTVEQAAGECGMRSDDAAAARLDGDFFIEGSGGDVTAFIEDMNRTLTMLAAQAVTAAAAHVTDGPLAAGPAAASVTAADKPSGDPSAESRIEQTIRRHSGVTLIGTSAEAIATALWRALRRALRQHDDSRAPNDGPSASAATSDVSVNAVAAANTAQSQHRQARPHHDDGAASVPAQLLPAANGQVTAQPVARSVTQTYAVPTFPAAWLERWKQLGPAIVLDVPRTPAEQMAVDERWAGEVAAGRRGPTVRFWQWAAPAVVVGRFQSIPDEVHEDVAAREGFAVVRRCTGGGAMFIEPGNTITYSLYAPRDFTAGLTVTQSYRLCDMWLIAALRGLGLEAGFSGVNDIASPAGKIGGAAQRRFPAQDGDPGAVLHHVTLAYDIDAAKMARVLNTSAEKMSDKAVRSAVRRVDPLRSQIGLSRDALVAALANSLADPDAWRVDTNQGRPLTAGLQ